MQSYATIKCNCNYKFNYVRLYVAKRSTSIMFFIQPATNKCFMFSFLHLCTHYVHSVAVGAQVFPLPPGQGFPWAHSTRGKPRRGMMRRAVFSGKC